MTSATPWSRAASLLALVVVPLLLFGPIVAAGRVFLPFVPVADEPLASEHPEAAALARRERNGMVGDRVYPFLVDQLSARAELRAGHLPTWEPLQTLGMPLFGGGIAGLSYPPNWLAFLLPPERAAAPLALGSLFLAGLGAWLFLRRLELDARAALFGALGIQLGGWGLANLHYYMKVDAALWLPWALWAVEGLARRRRWSATALVFALTLSFVAGMVTIAIFVLSATVLYALVRLRPGSEAPGAGARGLLATAALAGLGVAGSAVWTWPLQEASSASLRRPLSIDATVANAQPPALALSILVPDMVGPPADPTAPNSLPVAWWLTPASMAERAENANVLEWNDYALVALALLAVVGLVADPRRALFPATLLIGCFAFAQGWPLVRLLYALPGLGLGAPQRVLGLAWFLWPWLAALGVQALLARGPRALATLLVLAFAATLGFFSAWSRLDPAHWASALQATILERYPGLTSPEEVRARIPLEQGLAAARHLQESLLRAGCAALALGLAGLGALFLDRRPPHFARGPRAAGLLLGLVLPLAAAHLAFALQPGFEERGPQALLALSAALALTALALRGERAELVLWLPFALVLLAEGFLGSQGHVRGRALETELFPPSPAIEVIREAAGDGRVLRVDGSPDLGQAQRLARPNMLVPYGIHELTPYPTFTPGRATELALCIDPRMQRRNHVAPLPDAAELDSPVLDLMRAQCVLSTAPLRHPRLVPLLERDGFCVYRRTGALPPARIVPRALASDSDAQVLEALAAPAVDFAAATRIAPEDSARIPEVTLAPDWRPGTLTFEQPAKNRVRVRVADSRGGWLVLHEQWARGWRASVNGAPVPLLRADHAYRALPIPSGELLVELEYAPRALEWGAVISLLALGGVVLHELLNRPQGGSARTLAG